MSSIPLDTIADDQPPVAPAMDNATRAVRRYQELPRRPVRKPFGPLSYLIVTLFVASAAFYGGVLVEKHHVPASSGTATSAAASASRQRSTTGATTGAGATGTAPGVQGTITLIDGANVYVTDSSGNITKVLTTAQTQITATIQGTVQTLHIGDNVTVSGPTNANGQLQASSLRDTGAVAASRPASSSTSASTSGGARSFGSAGSTPTTGSAPQG